MSENKASIEIVTVISEKVEEGMPEQNLERNLIRSLQRNPIAKKVSNFHNF